MGQSTTRLAIILAVAAAIVLSLEPLDVWLWADDLQASEDAYPETATLSPGQEPAGKETGPALQGRSPFPTASPVDPRWIRGRLLKPNGSPLVGARIAVAPALHGPPPTIRPGGDLPTSGADGVFDVELPADASLARVLIHCAGYGGTVVPRWAAGTQRTVVVAEGPSCKGIVHGAEGEPVPDATLRFQMAAREGVLEFLTQTDQQGAYRLDGLLLHASGGENARDRHEITLRLRVHAEGLAVQDEDLPHTTETDVVYLIDFKLDRGRIIRGRVLDRGTGTPIGRAEVLLRAREIRRGLPPEGVINPFRATVLACGESDAMGRFRLEHVPAAHYARPLELVVGKAGFETRDFRSSELGTSLDGAVGSVTRVVACLRRGPPRPETNSKRRRGTWRTMTGRVLLPDGRPARGARVWWRHSPAPYKPGYRRPTYTDAEGHYRLRLRRQAGWVLAFLPGHALAWVPFANSVTEVGDVSLTPARSVSGTLVDGDGEPLYGYEVMAFVGHPPKGCGTAPARMAGDAPPPSVCIEKTSSDASGRFYFDAIPPGPVHVLTWLRSYRHGYPRVLWQTGVANVRGSGPLTIRVAFLHAKPETIPEPTLHEPETETSEPEEVVVHHTLRLRLEAPLGITPEEVEIELRDAEGHEVNPRTTASPHGALLALHDLLPGAYNVRIRVPGFQRVVLAAPLRLTAGTDVPTEVPLRLILGGTLQARIAIPIKIDTSDDGDSVSLEAPEVAVEVHNTSGVRVWQGTVGGWMTAGPRESERSFDRPQPVTRALPPGRYTLRAIHAGHTYSTPFRIRAGEVSHVHLDAR